MQPPWPIIWGLLGFNPNSHGPVSSLYAPCGPSHWTILPSPATRLFFTSILQSSFEMASLHKVFFDSPHCMSSMPSLDPLYLFYVWSRGGGVWWSNSGFGVQHSPFPPLHGEPGKLSPATRGDIIFLSFLSFYFIALALIGSY